MKNYTTFQCRSASSLQTKQTGLRTKASIEWLEEQKSCLYIGITDIFFRSGKREQTSQCCDVIAKEVAVLVSRGVFKCVKRKDLLMCDTSGISIHEN